MKVWPGGQRHQVMHNDVLTRCTTVGYFGGDQGAEVHGCGRLVPGETPKMFTMGSMTAHRCRMHGMEPAIDWIRLPVSQTEH